MAAGATPPHLDCAWVLVGAPVAYHQMTFQGGSYRKELVDGWLDALGGSYMKDEYAQHPNEDAYWDLQNLFTRLPQTKTPMVHVGGWYDIFDEGTVRAFSVLQSQAASGARWNQKLRMGPWTHGTIGQNFAGQAVYPPNALDGFAQFIDTIRWFDFWLKGKDTGIMDEPPVRTYVMGAEGVTSAAPGNVWRSGASWPPPATPTKYYFHPHGRLVTAIPGVSGGSDTLTYDPLAPVPTVGGPNLILPAGPYDQTAVEARPDVLSFTSLALTSPLEVSGNVEAHLFASSSATDTDWTVKLVDVYPDGRPLSVTDGVLRARHHLAFDSESLLTPGTIYEFVVDVWSTSLIFDTGHRIRIEVSSSNDTRFDPNPNTGHAFRADSQTETATNTIHHNATNSSYVVLPVVDSATAAGCATGSAITGLTLEKAAAGAIRFRWNEIGEDPCFSQYRLFGADDPTSWARFVRNPIERSSATDVTLPGAFSFYIVIAAGTDGGNGPHWPTP